jgi:O-acetyl-ADP-ribose deacetylase (regulator of RNase III)
LGSISYAHNVEYGIAVVNAYTQYDYRPTYDDDGVKRVDYEALRRAFRLIKSAIIYSELDGKLPSHITDHKTVRIGYPKIGCGLAGGDWNIVSNIIDEELDGLDHTLVEYSG